MFKYVRPVCKVLLSSYECIRYMIMVLLYKILSMTSTCVGIKKIIEKKMDPKNIFNELVFGIPNGPM